MTSNSPVKSSSRLDQLKTFTKIRFSSASENVIGWLDTENV